MDPGQSSLSQQKEKTFWSTKTNKKQDKYTMDPGQSSLSQQKVKKISQK